MRQRLVHSIVIALCLGIMAGQAGSSLMGMAAWAAQIVRVSQKGRAFALKTVEIARGDTLQFTNEDEFLHQIYIKSGGMSFDSDEQTPGQTISVRFPDSGTFDVRCHIHPTMLLVVTVK
ncbi:MAG TPA: plastocyanin/azurin family copper-binding protein [Alphaproteobacteria bacterium]|nr:plastocyanin/azurin family copper-binding protein [Alphaproteobacteria bacterium]